MSLRHAALALGASLAFLPHPASAHSDLAYRLVLQNGAAQHAKEGGGTVGPIADQIVVEDAGRSASGAVPALDHGHIALGAEARAEGQAATGGAVTMWSNPVASFGDDVTIQASDPSLFAQAGTFVATIEIEGLGSASAGGAGLGNSRASYTFRALIGTCPTSCEFDRYGEWYDFGGGVSGFAGDPPAILVTTPVPFTFGAQFHLDVSLSLFAQAAASTEPVLSESSLDFQGSVRWGGIQEVRDGKGELVSGFSVQSASGTDYAQAVPEPDAELLTGASLALAAALARRGRYGRITASV